VLADETMFKNGKANGVSKKYYNSGQLQWVANFKDGKKDGPAQSYSESGVLEWETMFKDGKLDGVARQYCKHPDSVAVDKKNEPGDMLCKEILYESGWAVSGYLYTEDGEKNKMAAVYLRQLNRQPL
jgi:hypothetical protein